MYYGIHILSVGHRNSFLSQRLVVLNKSCLGSLEGLIPTLKLKEVLLLSYTFLCFKAIFPPLLNSFGHLNEKLEKD